MVENTSQLETFRKVIEHGSFSAAARALGIGQPAVSKQMRALEQRLGVRLLERNSTRLAPTSAGHALIARLPPILDSLRQLEDDVTSSALGLAGVLRVHAPVALGEIHLTRELLRFQKLQPRIELDVNYDDRPVDLVKERVDVALRIGALHSPELVVRKLADLPRILAATPRYLRRFGRPRTPDELLAHNYLRNAAQAGAEILHLRRGQQELALQPKSRFLVNSVAAVRDLLLADAGIGQVSRWLVHRELRARRLVEVLPGFTVPPTVLHVVYPSATLKTKRVTALVDFLADALGRLPGLIPPGRA